MPIMVKALCIVTDYRMPVKSPRVTLPACYTSHANTSMMPHKCQAMLGAMVPFVDTSRAELLLGATSAAAKA